jgi:arylsulfatase A-like enzyme
MSNLKTFLIIVSVMLGLRISAQTSTDKPNILFIFIDDMGFGDLGCYGNADVHTPNIDQLAQEGIRLNQFYVNSPICSPSRTAVTTGSYPSRWGITSYISGRKHNSSRGMQQWLAPSAVTVAREMKKAGYYTAHIGKWHMGGGRDVGEAPLITEYGFDESLTQFEGLGDRYLATYETMGYKGGKRGLDTDSEKLGRGEIKWEKRENFTRLFVDSTMIAIENAKKAGKPFYINLWPDDIHTPLEPPLELRGDLSTKARFLGVMQEMDTHYGRLFDYIRSQPELLDNTLIVFTADNGPDEAVNDAGKLRGHKTVLYEGGIREPFIVWWPSQISKNKEGSIDKTTVMAGIDLMPTFFEIADLNLDNYDHFDGESMLSVLKGKPNKKRQAALFWIRPPDRPKQTKGAGDDAPDLAMRDGDYKLLMNCDGSNVELYNIIKDESETTNIASEKVALANSMKETLMAWYNDYPHLIDKNIYEMPTK